MSNKKIHPALNPAVKAKNNKYSSRIVIPSEYARATYLDKVPKLEAYKLLLYLCNLTRDDISSNQVWSVSLSDINSIPNFKHHSETEIKKLCNTILQTNICYDHPEGWAIGTVMDHIRTNFRDKNRNDILINFKFGEFFRDLCLTSDQYTVISSHIANQFNSKYALALYQHIQSLINLKFMTSVIKTPEELRDIVAVPERRQLTTSHFYGRIIKPAVNQINEIDPSILLQVDPLRSGQRKIKDFRLTWETLASRKQHNKKMNLQTFDHTEVLEQ